MKHFTTFILVLFVLACAAMTASAAKTIDPAVDTVFTCDSNPDDFNGKTFENLYVLLNSCKNLDSTVIPGNDAFLTLRDIKVTGTLYYTDDTYNAETDTYRASYPGETMTSADHYLNIAGDSEINAAHISCIDPHVCNFGIQYPIEISELNITPSNATNRGKIVVRGYIDPLIDIETDYYNDTTVKSFPDFNLKTFDNDWSHIWTDTNGLINFISLNGDIRYDIITNFDIITNERIEEIEKKTNAPSYVYKRGGAHKLTIWNYYAQNIGDTNIDLVNFYADYVFVANTKSFDDNETLDTYNLKWVPVLRAGGFTNIGVMDAYSSVKTDVVYSAPYAPYSEEIRNMILPMYIDALVVGAQDREVKVNISYTKIYMVNYLGGFGPYSKLDIHLDSYESPYDLWNIPSIGLATVYGGYLAIGASKAPWNLLTIGKLMVFSAREDFRYPDRDSIANNANSVGYFLTYDTPLVYSQTESENNFTSRLSPEYLAVYNVIGLNTRCQVFNPYGFQWIINVLENYTDLPEEGVKTDPNTRIHVSNPNLGDIVYDKAVSFEKNFSVDCQAHQYGGNTFTIDYIER